MKRIVQRKVSALGTNKTMPVLTYTAENFAIKGHLVLCYDTKVECNARIVELGKRPYYLRYCETGRPSLSTRYVIRYGKRRYYVFAEYKYDADFRRDFSCLVPKDGPYEVTE